MKLGVATCLYTIFYTSCHENWQCLLAQNSKQHVKEAFTKCVPQVPNKPLEASLEAAKNIAKVYILYEGVAVDGIASAHESLFEGEGLFTQITLGWGLFEGGSLIEEYSIF